jgi:GNAT superfamily N-acetyltransferase
MAGNAPEFPARMGEYVVDVDKSRLQIGVIHDFLAQSYWATNIPRDLVERSIAGSDCYGIYRGDEQVGFARVVTDRTRFAYVSDVFVLGEHRGKGLGKWLIGLILSREDYREISGWLLSTDDAHGLYGQFGFARADSTRVMSLSRRKPWSL